MNLTGNNNEPILSLDDIYFADAFTARGDKLDLEVDNINANCITSKSDNFSLDAEGNLIVNTITTKTGGSGDSFDLLSVYPIGSIYESVNATNPSVFFGGVWQLFGGGKMLVGVDNNDVDFNASEKTGGEKTVKLTSAQMPSHSHTPTNGSDYGFAAYKTGGGVARSRVSPSTVSGSRFTFLGTAGATVAADSGLDFSRTTGASGSGESHNNLSPYITVYRWKRIA